MFGQSTNSPFGAPAPSTPFGAPPATGPFGSSTTPAFGGFGTQQQQQPAPAFGGFGTQQPQQAAANPSGAFGGGFGTFGSPAPAPTGVFGAPATPTPFGAPAPAPTTGLFGAPAPAPTGGLFGTTTAPTAFGAAPATTPPFGGFGAQAPTSAFGTGTAFGAPAPAPTTGGLFGAPAPSPFGTSSIFGAPAPSSSLFGSPPAPSGGIFGSGAATTATAGLGSKVVPFAVTTTQDGSSTQVVKFQSITAMKPYENKSLEELRFEDYSSGNRGDGTSLTSSVAGFGNFGAPAPTQFGATGGFGAPSTNLTFGAPAPSAFGAPAPSAFGAPAPTPSIFGAFGAPAPSSGGLFGTPAPAPPAFGAAPAPTGGLFGNPAPVGGIFGSNPAPAPTFGAPAPSSSGLFGAPAPAPGSLFGAPAPAPSGLFGAPAPGGLFGSPTPAPGGLFGAPAPSTGGLFGSPTPAPAFGAPAPSGVGLFGGPAPASSGGFFGAPAPTPSGFGGFGAQPPATGGLFGSLSPAPAFGSTFGAPPAQSGLGGGSLFGAPAPALAYPAAPPQNIIPLAADAALQQRLAAIQQQTKELEKMEIWRGDSLNSAIVVPSSLPESDVLRVSPYAESSVSYRASPRWNQKIKPRGFGLNSPSSPPNSSLRGWRTPGTPLHTPSSIVASSAKRLVIRESNTPKPGLRLRLEMDGGDVPPIPIANGASTPVAGTSPSPRTASPGPNHLPKNEGGLVGSEKKIGTPSDDALAFYNQVVGSPVETPLRQSNGHLVPTLTKSGYRTTPTMSEIAKMSEADLAALPGFSITRDGYGSVAWLDNVDVRGIDLDSIISIEHNDVSVYDDQETSGTKPAVGEKLNRPAIITFFNTFHKKGPNAPDDVKDKFLKKLEKACAEMNAEFISYDKTRGIWKFRVHHFSRYRLLDDDSDDDEEVQPPSTGTLAKVGPPVAVTTAQSSDFKTGGRGGRPQVLDKYVSPTRFVVPSDDDEDMNIEMTTEDDIVIVDDLALAESVEDAYKTMFLSPRKESKAAAVVEVERVQVDVFDEEGLCWDPPSPPGVEAPHEFDMIMNRGYGICHKIMSVQGIPKSSVDMGLRMGRSFRVGWRPDGSFLHVKSGTVLTQSRPLFSDIDISRSSTNVLDILLKYKQSKDPSGFTMEGLSNQEIISAIEEMVVAISHNEDNLHHCATLRQSLALILCLLKSRGELWVHLPQRALPESDLVTLKNIETMEAFRQWLKGACTSTAKADVENAKRRGDVHGAIFVALSSGDTTAAASIATENGFLQLAAIILAGPNVAELIRDQVFQWYQTGASAKIDPGLMRIYKILGGDFSLEENKFRDGDHSCGWMARLGLLLTYGKSRSGASYDFASLVNKYDQDVEAGLAPEPKPHYVRDSTWSSSVKSVLFSIIRLSNAITQGLQSPVAIRDVIHPLSHTPSHHDLAGSFLLAVVLASLNCCSNLSEVEQARLLSGYAAQLVCNGNWESAVNAMLCSVGPSSLRQWRLKQAKEILLQNYSPDNKSCGIFLTEKLGLPRAWVEEAAAGRLANSGDVFAYVSHLKEISREEARGVLESYLVPTILFQNPRASKDSLNMLKALTPVNDESLTASVSQLFELSMAIKDFELQQTDSKESIIAELQAKAECIENRFIRHKAAIGSISSTNVPSIARAGVPMACFLSECLSGVSFLKLQLRALEMGNSIWDSSNGVTFPMRFSSQLVANSGIGVKSNALKGYS